MVYTSGQLSINKDTGEMPDNIKEQTEQSLKNVKVILEEAGTKLENVIKTMVSQMI